MCNYDRSGRFIISFHFENLFGSGRGQASTGQCTVFAGTHAFRSSPDTGPNAISSDK